MQYLEIKRQADFDRKPYINKHAEHSHYDQILTSDVRVHDKDTGRHVLTFVKPQDVDPASLLRALEQIKFQEGFRTQGLKRRSVVFGYQPRLLIRRDCCSIAMMAVKQPVVHRTLINYGRVASFCFMGLLPALFKKQVDHLDKEVHEDWHIKGMPFTSGIVNKACALHYHRDAGNFTDCNSMMWSIARDMEHGSGLLVIPEYRIALEFNGFELLIFNGSKVVHGVTAIKQKNPNAYRYTVVYYGLKKMCECLPKNEELARIKKTAADRQRWRTSEHQEERKAKLLGQHGLDDEAAKGLAEKMQKFRVRKKRSLK